MRLQQSFPNPYSRLLQKDYGTEHPQTPWIDRHGPKVGAAIMALSAMCVIGACILLFVIRVAG